MSTPPQPSWVPGATGSLYDVDNLPYGVWSPPGGGSPRVGVRIGDLVLDLAAAARSSRAEWVEQMDAPALNPLMAKGSAVWAEVRAWVIDLLTDPAQEGVLSLVPVADVTMHMPFEVADYVDYYASLDHATNVGRIFRPDGEPLAPNWRHLPVAYHGRAGSVVVSGTDIIRPCGQRRLPGEELPSFGPTERLDIEAELGFVVGRATSMGERVGTDEFFDTVFGVVGVNDWSARDIQAWETTPLGPNLGKSFGTSISAWVTPLAALEGARVELPGQEPAVLPYLEVSGPAGYDIEVEIEVNGTVVSRPSYRTQYWSPAQMLAHLTVNGAPLRVGDLFASGTISGPEREQRGCFLELSWGGVKPWRTGDEERTFLADGDHVVLRYLASAGPRSGGQAARVGLGDVSGSVSSAV